MGLVAWIELIKGVLQFPEAILKIVKGFQKTPAQKHDELLIRIDQEAAKFEESGRPSW
jgi:hypothetical protein